MDHPLIEDVQDMTQVDLCKQRYDTLVSHYWLNNSWVSLKEIDLCFNHIQLSLNVVSIYPSY